MDVATATAMFSDAAKSTMRALGMGWRAWGSQPATESPARLIDLARAIQRFPATDTNYAAALTGPQSGEYATVLASALAAGTPDPAVPASRPVTCRAMGCWSSATPSRRATPRSHRLADSAARSAPPPASGPPPPTRSPTPRGWRGCATPRIGS